MRRLILSRHSQKCGGDTKLVIDILQNQNHRKIKRRTQGSKEDLAIQGSYEISDLM